MDKPHTVIAVLEAKPEKAQELETALNTVVAKSRDETTCLEYRLHKSIENPSQFILYENWVNQEKHQQQFTKPYIIELSKKLADLLAKPHQVFMGSEIV